MSKCEHGKWLKINCSDCFNEDKERPMTTLEKLVELRDFIDEGDVGCALSILDDLISAEREKE